MQCCLLEGARGDRTCVERVGWAKRNFKRIEKLLRTYRVTDSRVNDEEKTWKLDTTQSKSCQRCIRDKIQREGTGGKQIIRSERHVTDRVALGCLGNV
jgi:hypothetical protein